MSFHATKFILSVNRIGKGILILMRNGEISVMIHSLGLRVHELSLLFGLPYVGVEMTNIRRSDTMATGATFLRPCAFYIPPIAVNTPETDIDRFRR
jgi:hypothetical protein